MLSSESYQCKAKIMLIEKKNQEEELRHFIEAGNTNDVKRLISRGGWMDLNYFDTERETPLILAAAKGHADLVHILLSNGALPDLSTKFGRTPLQAAANYCSIGLQLCSRDVVQLLVDRKADPNRSNNFATTPLHLTANNGCADVAKILLEVGAQPNMVDKHGRTPLHLAIDSWSTQSRNTAKLLLDGGAEPNKEDKSGMTPLHWAACGGNGKNVGLLLARGAEPGRKDEFGRTPMQIAAERGHENLVQLLMAHTTPGQVSSASFM